MWQPNTTIKLNIFGIVIALLLGTTILTVSLVQASASSLTQDQTTNSTKHLRFDDQVIPGHILYPLTVLQDKVQLKMLSPEEQCQKEMEIARQRLLSAKLLLEAGNTQLALITYAKGHNYLGQSALTIQSLPDTDSSLKTDLHQHLLLYQKFTDQHKDQFADHQKVMLDQLLAENEAISTHLGF